MDELRLAMPENPHQMTGRLLMLAWGELALAQHQPDLALRQCELLLATAPQRVAETEAHVIPLLWKCQGEALFALDRTANIAPTTHAVSGVSIQGQMRIIKNG